MSAEEKIASEVGQAAREAVVREHHNLFRAAQAAVGLEPVDYDALSDRTKRIQHRQMDPLADAAVAAALRCVADLSWSVPPREWNEVRAWLHSVAAPFGVVASSGEAPE